MSKDLREAMMAVMVDLCTCITAASAYADKLVKAAADLSHDQLLSETMRETARRERVRILEMEAKLAALNIAYTERFDTEP